MFLLQDTKNALIYSFVEVALNLPEIFNIDSSACNFDIMAANLSMIVAKLPPYLQEQVPHYEETLRPNIYAATGICLVLAYVSVGLRLYGRRLQGQALWWDDYMSIVALVSHFRPHDAPTTDEVDLTM